MTSKKICRTKTLTHEALAGLAQRKYMALCIHQYYDAKVAKRIANKLCSSKLVGTYKNAPIARAGQAFFEGLSSPEVAEKYRKSSTKWIKTLREECDPYLLPIDRIRLEIDEAWWYGAHLGNVHSPNRPHLKAFAGLVRIFYKGSGTEIHQDKLDWDLEQIHQESTDVMKQFAVNVYLDLPEKGGEVRLWRDSLNKKEYEYLRNDQSYGVGQKSLPKPDLVFRPQVGDLWIFRASELHQVVESGDGRRVTQSCFLGYQGDEKHLIIWS